MLPSVCVIRLTLLPYVMFTEHLLSQMYRFSLLYLLYQYEITTITLRFCTSTASKLSVRGSHTSAHVSIRLAYVSIRKLKPSTSKASKLSVRGSQRRIGQTSPTLWDMTPVRPSGGSQWVTRGTCIYINIYMRGLIYIYIYPRGGPSG